MQQGRILEDLAANGSDIAAKVLDWRQIAKLKSTYTDALIEELILKLVEYTLHTQ